MTRTALMILFLLLMAGCVTKTILLTPPENLLEDCPIPTAEVKTNADLAQLAVSRRNALEYCNADKEALRAWANRANGGPKN